MSRGRSPWSRAQEKARRKKLVREALGRGDWGDEPTTRCPDCRRFVWLNDMGTDPITFQRRPPVCTPCLIKRIPPLPPRKPKIQIPDPTPTPQP